MPLEVAVFSPTDAILAGACPSTDRIELCTDYSLGGLTLPLADLRAIRAHWTAHGLTTPLYAMIRPPPPPGTDDDSDRDGFTPDAVAFAQMEAQITERLGLVDGFVFGVLLPGGAGVDEARCLELVRLVGGRARCTFHRAVDRLADPAGAVEALAGCGFEGVLSAGGGGTAVEGAALLRAMVGAAEGKGLTVVVGGGVRSGNAAALRRETGAEWLHTAALVDGKLSVDEIRRIKMAM